LKGKNSIPPSMKLRYVSLLFLFVLSVNCAPVQAQVEDSDEPQYVTITTLYGVHNFDFQAWKAVEEEYYDKVTSKIDLIKSHEVLVSYFSPLNSEIKVINVIDNWTDIAEINEMRSELIEEGWPDLEERNRFFEKQNSFYKSKHSDEIYLTTHFRKDLVREPGQNVPFVFMVRTNILSDSEDEHSYENYKQYVKQVLFENSKILAYYPFNHFWGADSREFVEIFVVDSFSDVELSGYENHALMTQMIPDEQERTEFLRSMNSAVESQNTAFFKNVPSLSK